MGLVVSFQPRVAASHQRNQAAGQAAIIIFPGVRYERTPDADERRPGERIAASGLPAPVPKH